MGGSLLRAWHFDIFFHEQPSRQLTDKGRQVRLQALAVPLARTGMHAVHAVVDRQQVVELLGPLRGAGASSILVLPIENLVP